jgi:TfoX/Sxy family transcriptional regulator of competence genes
MGVDDDIAGCVRAALSGAGAVREVKMFGGIGFMLNGNFLAGASKRGLLVRIGKDGHQSALRRKGARPMEMRGRVMEGYVYVDPPLTGAAVKEWTELALDFVRTLPPKAGRAKAGKPKRTRGMAKGKRR